MAPWREHLNSYALKHQKSVPGNDQRNMLQIKLPTPVVAAVSSFFAADSKIYPRVMDNLATMLQSDFACFWPANPASLGVYDVPTLLSDTLALGRNPQWYLHYGTHKNTPADWLTEGFRVLCIDIPEAESEDGSTTSWKGHYLTSDD